MTDEEIAEAALRQKVKGRRTVLIRIEYAGKGQPGKQLRERCDTLVEMMKEADAGVIAGRKDGVGEVVIHVLTKYPDHTIEQAQKFINELKIDRATTKIEEE
jgi:hypothetical protein